MHKMSLALPANLVDEIRLLAFSRGQGAAEIARLAILVGLPALRGHRQRVGLNAPRKDEDEGVRNVKVHPEVAELRARHGR